MALVAWLRDGSEVVLLQSWILLPAWLFGRAAGNPRAGLLAGFALVGGAVWAYEVLPMWGFHAMPEREFQPSRDLDALALQFDREDIVLISTLAIGGLVGLGGGLRSRPLDAESPEPPAEPPRAFAPPQPPPPPLWARIEPSPSVPLAEPQPPLAPEPQPAGRSPVRSATPWGVALLVAATTTDVLLARLYDMYTGPQGGLALAFAIGGGLAAVWLARRYALAMLVAGAVLGSAFATVQHAEYEARAEPEPATAVR
jgi:hypothetical protein